ncbi:MAG: hypothetical protein ACPGUV_13255 [Polyangiales bacterium]
MCAVVCGDAKLYPRQLPWAASRFSDVGIGHSRDGQRRRRCIVVLLAAWPRVQTL